MSQGDVETVRRVLGPFEQGDLVPLFRDEAISASIIAAALVRNRLAAVINRSVAGFINQRHRSGFHALSG